MAATDGGGHICRGGAGGDGTGLYQSVAVGDRGGAVVEGARVCVSCGACVLRLLSGTNGSTI